MNIIESARYSYYMRLCIHYNFKAIDCCDKDDITKAEKYVAKAREYFNKGMEIYNKYEYKTAG